MNGRRTVSGGLLIVAGALLALPAVPVLLVGDPAALPVALVAGLGVVLGTILLVRGVRAPARRRPAGIPAPRRRHADTAIPNQGPPDSYSWWDSTHHRWGDGWSGGGDSGGGGG
ncbi:hypothetical protein E1211_03325, partial [Micromonospora sp. 15K316]|uniref:phage holin family protein n=1 Tax=Micromonospora sp. 15K316 TaxID=2530376 RepID=UPI0010EE5130